MRNHLALYLVTDDQPDLLTRTEAALEGGVTCVQLRLKQADSGPFLHQARAMAQLCRNYNVPFIVNDRADIAHLSDADMLHIGQSDLPLREARSIVGSDMPIGVSAATVEEAKRAEEEGAAYLGVGSLFPTQSKVDATPIDPEMVRKIRDSVSLPIVLIGGINQSTLSDAESLIRATADGIAIVSAILSTPDPREAAASLRYRMDSLLSHRSLQ
ncbi:thiamine-phosphate diphosphorylase [Marininema mesophilum]|uniref:Thiamine-phosphate synthase n=1 Tax=Marininema mesophilum TaxID=1048340 RepID=A0A1H2ZGV9_9BACL|nr:thiamine phosphate synthase [Marininema mesophilum]SDX16557.1 thiamine-phosphate diphosphorylase [Marininema mesophilum]